MLFAFSIRYEDDDTLEFEELCIAYDEMVSGKTPIIEIDNGFIHEVIMNILELSSLTEKMSLPTPQTQG